MLCARCKKNAATVVLKQIVDNQVSELRLCAHCADAEPSLPADPALLGLLALLGGATARERAAAARCPSCGLRWADFRKTGTLGCHGCYEAFAEPLKAVLKEMQGSVKHAGKSPTGSAPYPARPTAGTGMERRRVETEADLRAKLEEALRRERYEEAARLRDRIHRLKDS
ncbi:MAG: UvrB/UvrC motif-containing protein [Elusimicrobia bacterium]|nr:UvrB/UvrC motif-containing protein [Elusimicrobiota bacterium]